MTVVLGIYLGHNATVALVQNGKVLSAVSEERFSGRKNHSGYPRAAVDYCLTHAGISSRELDRVTLPVLTGAPGNQSEHTQRDSASRRLAFMHLVSLGVRSRLGALTYRSDVARRVSDLTYSLASRTAARYANRQLRGEISSLLSIPATRVRAYDHHLSHAAAYFASPFNRDDALVMVLDGEGDDCSATIYVAKDGSLRQLARSPRSASLGILYMAVTIFLGMKANEHEYKVMGLAPYAKDEDVERVLTKLRGIIYPDPSNPLVFRSRFNTWDTLHFLDDQFRRTRFDHLAGAAQRLVEELVVDWVNTAVARTGIRTVVLAGGVFMNVKVNKLLMESPSVENLWVMPSAGDESSPIGAAYLASRELGVRDFAPITNVYWGPSFSSSEVENALTETGAFGRYVVTRHEDINAEVARLLAAGGIVARFRGRMEFGARALGNRSILAHPGNPDVIRVINEQVKNRDFWMPFAPSILAEWVDRYVAGTVKTPSPHMMVGFESTNLARTHLRAALHPYDLTMRPQMVTREDAPDYHDLLSKFATVTGTGGVLNTSFNIHGKPIVMSPRDALAAFADCGLTMLALEDYLVTKLPSGVEL
ncbi:MAG: hypothetical protein KGR25_03660 [Chloroflexi bacterium]|nr:hypothetical protein [Chloroflexota bacterium]